MDTDDFFGFDPTQQDDGPLSGDREYDFEINAYNDETFGTVASTGDWEGQHRQLSGLTEQEEKQANAHTSALSHVGVCIPEARSQPLYGGGTESVSNGAQSMALPMPSMVGPYSTPPKPSLIDPVKLSESPGNGIWAPEPSMLEKITFPPRISSNKDIQSDLFNLMQQSSSTANQQQMSFLNDRLQPHQQLFNNGSRILNDISSSSQLPGLAMQQQQQQQQQRMANVNKMVGSLSLEGMRPGAPGSALHLGLGGNAKSVADLEMEMRLQQLKTNAGVSDPMVRAEDLERQTGSRAAPKPLQPFFTEEQHMQQIQQNQLMEIQQKRPSHQHNTQHHHHQRQQHQQYQHQHQQPQQQQQQQQQLQQQQQQHNQFQQHAGAPQPHVQLHPLTGQPLNPGPNMQQQPPGINPLNRMQQPSQLKGLPSNPPAKYQLYQQQQQQQQQQMLSNFINKGQMNQRSDPPPHPLYNISNPPPPHFNQNYQNFPNGQRSSNSSFYNGNNNGSNGNSYNNYGGSRQNGSSWNNSSSNEQRNDNLGQFFEQWRHNNNRRDTFEQHRNNGRPDFNGGYDRNNGNFDRNNGSYERNSVGSYDRNNSGRVRRDSELEWEEWERKREVDEYAGLMTPKQKSWLRNIQTMQLATENPYTDDYYYVMYKAKRARSDPRTPLHIEGLDALLPAVGDQEKDAASTYQPPNMENSLGKLQVASVNAPRKIMDLDAVHLDMSEPTTKVQMEYRLHRRLLLLIEQLYGEFVELRDLERKIMILVDSPTRDNYVRRKKQLADTMWLKIAEDQEQMLAMLNVRKGKTLIVKLLKRLDAKASENVIQLVLVNLPQLTRNSQPEYQNTLNILWPIADKMLSLASPRLLVEFASFLLPHLEDDNKSPAKEEAESTELDDKEEDKKPTDLTPVLASKFGISVIVALLLRGEQVYSEMIDHNIWQAFLEKVIALLANIQNPNIITDTLVRDSDSGGSKSGNAPPVVVLGRGQSLSSLAKQLATDADISSIAAAGNSSNRLTPPLPMVEVSRVAGSGFYQPSDHLARCTEQVNLEVLAAAQTALQRISPEQSGGLHIITISTDEPDKVTHIPPSQEHLYVPQKVVNPQPTIASVNAS